MRVILGFAAILTLVALAQPALAVCVNRGGVTNCTRDGKYPKYPNATQKLEPELPAENPETKGKTIVLRPGGSSSDAWVMVPQSGSGAVVLSSVSPGTLACGSSAGC
jgi:hypothetical protein